MSEEVSEAEIREAEEVRDALAKMIFMWAHPSLDWDCRKDDCGLVRLRCTSLASKLMFCFYISTWELEEKRLKESANA